MLLTSGLKDVRCCLSKVLSPEADDSNFIFSLSFVDSFVSLGPNFSHRSILCSTIDVQEYFEEQNLKIFNKRWHHQHKKTH